MVQYSNFGEADHATQLINIMPKSDIIFFIRRACIYVQRAEITHVRLVFFARGKCMFECKDYSYSLGEHMHAVLRTNYMAMRYARKTEAHEELTSGSKLQKLDKSVYFTFTSCGPSFRAK